MHNRAVADCDHCLTIRLSGLKGQAGDRPQGVQAADRLLIRWLLNMSR